MEIITPVRISAWNGLNRPLMFACFGALTFAIIFHSLTQYINQDEEAFVTPAFLAQNLRIYIDFIYLQSPIYPLVVSKLFILFRESPFLIARLFSAALAIGSVFVFFMLASRFSRNKWFGLLLSCLLASAPLMLLAYGSARNDIMPIFF